jgi:hypothetical protein
VKKKSDKKPKQRKGEKTIKTQAPKDIAHNIFSLVPRKNKPLKTIHN